MQFKCLENFNASMRGMRHAQYCHVLTSHCATWASSPHRIVESEWLNFRPTDTNIVVNPSFPMHVKAGRHTGNYNLNCSTHPPPIIQFTFRLYLHGGKETVRSFVFAQGKLSRPGEFNTCLLSQ